MGFKTYAFKSATGLADGQWLADDMKVAICLAKSAILLASVCNPSLVYMVVLIIYNIVCISNAESHFKTPGHLGYIFRVLWTLQ